MKDVEILIKISEEAYNLITGKIDIANIDLYSTLINATVNGTPLPKGHGDLVDISPYKGKVICSHLYSGVKKLVEVDNIKPIIEADREE